MKEGNVIIASLTQADEKKKNRPAIVLRELPLPHRDFLVCGISSNIHLAVKGFDEIISQMDSDYRSSGVVTASLIRLGFLSVLPQNNIIGSIGEISVERHRRLLRKLSDYLRQGI